MIRLLRFRRVAKRTIVRTRRRVRDIRPVIRTRLDRVNQYTFNKYINCRISENRSCRLKYELFHKHRQCDFPHNYVSEAEVHKCTAVTYLSASGYISQTLYTCSNLQPIDCFRPKPFFAKSQLAYKERTCVVQDAYDLLTLPDTT